MKFEIINQTDFQPPFSHIENTLKIVLGFFHSQKVLSNEELKLNLYIVFVDENKMKELNFQFRNKDKPTDVLSFAPNEENFLGELVFCPKILEKQAKENNHSQEDELSYLLIHGLLHLFGYDHEESEEEAKEMFHLQDQAFELIRSIN